MMSPRLSLEDPRYIKQTEMRWRCLPLSMIVIEFWGNGDPAFGGSADDWVLGQSGSLFRNTFSAQDAVAVFDTIEAAHAAALRIPNRREGSILGVAPTWR